MALVNNNLLLSVPRWMVLPPGLQWSSVRAGSCGCYWVYSGVYGWRVCYQMHGHVWFPPGPWDGSSWVTGWAPGMSGFALYHGWKGLEPNHRAASGSTAGTKVWRTASRVMDGHATCWVLGQAGLPLDLGWVGLEPLAVSGSAIRLSLAGLPLGALRPCLRMGLWAGGTPPWLWLSGAKERAQIRILTLHLKKNRKKRWN